MKNLITAAIIALTGLSATTVKADPVEDAVQCVYDYFDKYPHGQYITESGKESVANIAGVYDLSNIFSGIDEDRAERYRQGARDLVKSSFDRRHVGEINYCFRQQMGE